MIHIIRISPTNPFAAERPLLGNQPGLTSPQVSRLRAMWKQMRPVVVKRFPAPDEQQDAETYVASLEDIYQHDAYNSLSIEGYRVTPDIIERVRSDNWDPEKEEDRQHVAAMAAKGYHDAYNLVEQTVRAVVKGGEPAELAKKNLQDWYRALFSASIQAGILEATDVAGYRNRPVYISDSNHVPPAAESLMDCMETLFDLLDKEKSAAVRAVLGHFTFVFVHPYPDGNGRIGRFLMNLVLASGGYPWTVVRLARRDTYMDALERASVDRDISIFTDFIAEEMRVDWTVQK